MRLRCLALGLCGLLVVAGTAFAQERTGGIAGTIKDSSGAHSAGRHRPGHEPVAGRRADRGRPIDQGNYRFPALTPGVYEITATLQGFTAAKATERPAGARPAAEDRSRAGASRR